MEKIEKKFEKPFKEEGKKKETTEEFESPEKKEDEEEIKSILMESPLYETLSEKEIDELVKKILEYFAEKRRREKE